MEVETTTTSNVMLASPDIFGENISQNFSAKLLLRLYAMARWRS